MSIILSGACGRMGQAVARQALQEGFEILFGVDPRGESVSFPVFSSFGDVNLPVKPQDVIIDFSAPAALPDLLNFAVANDLPCILASTGYTQEQLDAITMASASIPVFRSANMSLGIAVLKVLAQKAASVLYPAGFDIEIVEAHHGKKKDAPSGTALLLLDGIRQCPGLENLRRKDGRSGLEGERPRDEIGMHALRGGTVAGEHEVCFFGPMERLKLSHSAEDRAVFAQGALRAAAFMQGKAPGLYSMDDLVAGMNL
ncbi:MAG: 4-hydroxy-tetrahydrodipicolinate reductase [Clostridia bacterium]|nr:4-hydroxy-tetrahydrodipicolinate reductase [Clostridia bacterium]